MAAAASNLRHIRTDQVGSLVNPQFLLDAFPDHGAGKLSDGQRFFTSLDHTPAHRRYGRVFANRAARNTHSAASAT